MFSGGLEKDMNSGSVVSMVWEAFNVKTGRIMLGETHPADSKPGTIRGDSAFRLPGTWQGPNGKG